MTVTSAQGPENAAAGNAADTWRKLRESGDIQFEPVVLQQKPREPGLIERFFQWLGDLLRPLGEAIGLSWPVIEKVLIALLVLLVLVVLWYLVGRPLLDRMRQPAPDAQEPDWTPDRGAALALLDDADKLAAAGRYAEAVHLLLQRSVGHIADARPEWLHPASTAREIAGFAMLPESARAAFGVIAARVERSRFALRDLDSADWEAARGAYADFALAEFSA